MGNECCKYLLLAVPSRRRWHNHDSPHSRDEMPKQRGEAKRKVDQYSQPASSSTTACPHHGEIVPSPQYQVDRFSFGSCTWECVENVSAFYLKWVYTYYEVVLLA